MPSMRPSRFCSRSRTASVTAGARKKAVMNFAEPSGSSPPENPPGSMMIWLLLMALTSASVLSATLSGDRLLMMNVSATAPACSNARAESYSQLLPGNTGMMTRGFAMVPLYTSGNPSRKLTASTVSPAARYGNTGSSLPSHASCSSARSTASPQAANSYASVVSPTSSTRTASDDAGSSAHAASSTRKLPYAGANSSSARTSSASFTPMPLPRHILNSASAVAPYPGVDTASARSSPIRRSTSSNASTNPAASGVTPS